MDMLRMAMNATYASMMQLQTFGLLGSRSAR